MSFLLLIREFKKPRQRRRGQRRLKHEFTFYLWISRCPKVVYFVYHCQSYHKTESGHIDKFEIKISKVRLRAWFTFSRQPGIWSFHVVVLQRKAKKCTKNYYARAQPLYRSLNLLFSDVAIVVAVVVFLSLLLLVSSNTFNDWQSKLASIDNLAHSQARNSAESTQPCFW